MPAGSPTVRIDLPGATLFALFRLAVSRSCPSTPVERRSNRSGGEPMRRLVQVGSIDLPAGRRHPSSPRPLPSWASGGRCSSWKLRWARGVIRLGANRPIVAHREAPRGDGPKSRDRPRRESPSPVMSLADRAGRRRPGMPAAPLRPMGVQIGEHDDEVGSRAERCRRVDPAAMSVPPPPRS